MWTMLKDRRMTFLMIANILSSIGSGITMIGVPWLLVNRAGGSEIFGYATLASTIILFFLSPHIGVYIDRISRKKMLLGSEVIGGSVTLLFALWGLRSGHFETWQLIVIYFSGSLYYNVHFPTQFAFTQEIFSKEQYKTLNSILEVQNQSTSMIAGGLASLLIDHIDFAWILLADAMTYFFIFSLSIVFFYVFPLVSIFLLFKTLNGWGNAGSRVARNTILMEMVPNHLIGRVNSFFNTVGMGMRVLLIGVCTQIVSFQGARMAILLLGVLLVVSFIGLIASRPLFNVTAQTKNEALPQEI